MNEVPLEIHVQRLAPIKLDMNTVQRRMTGQPQLDYSSLLHAYVDDEDSARKEASSDFNSPVNDVCVIRSRQ